MAFLNGKTILIISPQAWGTMFLSKHHYAIELAAKGNRVYFLNPPDETHKSNGFVEFIKNEEYPNLTLINHGLFFNYNFKFHIPYLFHRLMRLQISRILKLIDEPIEIVWSFDIGHLYPFKFFPDESLKIFHPVDEPLNNDALNAATGAQVIFSVTREILEKYKNVPAPKYFINHGVSKKFLEASVLNDYVPGHSLRVGYAGNLLRNDIDRTCLLQIIEENPAVKFEFWGAYKYNDSNIGGAEDLEIKHFIRALTEQANVVLHGPVPSSELVKAYQRVDAFIICYDILKDQSKGTNYHKVTEYLSTGKVIISNNITTYKETGELLVMTNNRENNGELPVIFKQVMNSISYYNSKELMQQRRQYAQENLYPRQLELIDNILQGLN